MRWLRTYPWTMALLLAACSDDTFDPLGLDDGSTTSPPEPTFDYATCPAPMQDATCLGSECGRTPEAEGYLAIMLEVVLEAGHAAAFTPTEAEYFPLVDDLRIDYQLQVSWYRAATSVHFDVPDTEELLREEMAAHVAGWRVPIAVAAPDEIEAAVEGCHSLLDYDPCLDNHPDFYVYEHYDWADPACVYKSTSVVVDAADASTLECVVEEPQPCD